MNKRFITLQMLGISLASFSQLFCATPEEQPGIGKRISTLSAPAISASTEERQNIINRFSQGMNADDKHKVIETVAKVPAEHIQTFKSTVNRLTQGMDRGNKTIVFRYLAKVPAERLDAFIATVNNLSQGMKAYQKYKAIEAVAEVPADHLTPNFVTAVNNFSQGMDCPDKNIVFRYLAKVPAERLDACIATVNNLSQGMNAGDKCNVIEAVAAMHDERLTPEFEVAVNNLSQGMNRYDKCNVIKAVAKIPAEHLTSVLNAFTPQILQDLNQVTQYERADLIRRLAGMEPAQYQAEITRTINLYRHNNVVAQPGVSHEVHYYANTQVTPGTASSSSGAGSSSSSSGSSSASSGSAAPMRLVDAVMGNMNQRLQTANMDSLSYADAKKLLEQWIEQKYSNSSANSSELERAKHAAFAKLVSDTNYEQVISTAVSFLQRFHPESVDLWLGGFLNESMNAYGNNGESCAKGIQERVATGMRKIDPELDKLFAQAEGPALVNKFIGNLNLSDKERCEKITKELVKLGLNADSDATHAGELFERYIRNWFTESGVSADRYSSDIKRVKDYVATEGGFEAYIEPIVKKPVYEAKRALKAEQDAEYAASLTQDQAASAGSASSSSSSSAVQAVASSNSELEVAPGAAAQEAEAPVAQLTKEQQKAQVRASWLNKGNANAAS